MDRQFESAADWVQRISAPMISDGKCNFIEIDPMEPILRLQLGIYWMPNEEGGMASSSGGHFFCHEGAAAYLLSICEKSPAAYDLLKQITADFIARDEPLSPSLKTFSVLYLSDRLTRPRRQRAFKTAFRAISIYTWARTAASDYGLDLTRNEATSDHVSACDAVAEGLARNGHHISFDAVKEICVGTTNKRVREISRMWVEAHDNARKAGIIPKHVLDRLWYGV